METVDSSSMGWVITISTNIATNIVSNAIHSYWNKRNLPHVIAARSKKELLYEIEDVLRGLPSLLEEPIKKSHIEYFERHRQRIEAILQRYDRITGKIKYDEYEKILKLPRENMQISRLCQLLVHVKNNLNVAERKRIS